MVISCHTNKENTNTEKNIASEIVENKGKETFYEFIEKFSKDSLFQMSRINFPMIVKEIDSENDFEIIEKPIQGKDYKTFDFSIQGNSKSTEFDKYEQKTILKGNKAVIEFRGIGNGIYADYFFEKSDGKWKFKTYEDVST